jgi:hypothetical protein
MNSHRGSGRQHMLGHRGMGQAVQNANVDPEALSLQILETSSEAITPAMIPVAELSPQGSVASNGNSVGAGATSAGISIQWPCNGYLVGIRATTRDGAVASACGMLLRVQVDGTYELFPSAAGQGAGFMSLAMISGNAGFLGRYAVRRRFMQTTYWTIYLQNTTGGTLVADVAFDYVNTSAPPQ